MKATDLMIGDWVYNPFTRKTLRLTFGRDLDIAEELCLEPIPLTAEIIDTVSHHPKMALYWDDKKTEETGENWYELRICKDGDTALTMEIRYVHELQHALRLCGIEERIEL